MSGLTSAGGYSSVGGGPYSNAITWTYDGDQQVMGNTDASLMHIGAWAQNSGTIAGLLGGGDFAHLIFAHNLITNNSGVITNTNDYTSTSYAMVWSDNGFHNIYQAPATGVLNAAPVLNATPTFSLNMLTGALTLSGTLTLSAYSTAGLLQNNASGTVSTNSTITTASTPSNFSASGRIAVNMGGTTVYIPYDSTTW
jgi:hypothetical protein